VIELTPEMATIIMLVGLVVGILTGFPLALAVGSVGLIMGLLTRGLTSVDLTYAQMFSKSHGYTFMAIPMFVYMGSLLESSGIAERMYNALFLFLGKLRGGLAICTVAVGAVVATSVGVISASVSMLSLVALPAMVRRGYDKALASGTVCASGTLGILIPPSIMLVVVGPLSNVSVGRLFAAAFIPGFLLAALYMLYVGTRCAIQKNLGPSAPAEDRAGISIGGRLLLLARSLVPPALVIIAVLGSILLGLASPTEAAAFGGFATTIMVIAYRRFTLTSLKKALNDTMRVTGLGLLIATLSVAYTSVFLVLGGGEVVANFILAAPGGRWGSFALIMFIVFVLGMFMDGMGIVFIIIPILLPSIDVLGFDLLWSLMMVVIMIQSGFLSPPFATALFVLRGTADPSLGIEYGHLIRGVYPFIAVVFVVIVLCAVFPDIILWLPRLAFG
jgi:tripartite ATP-independent transporter DctM subunit